MEPQNKNAFSLVLTELVFVYLPLVVLLVYHAIKYMDRYDHTYSTSSTSSTTEPSLLLMITSEREISFATAVLFGLSAIKCHIAAGKKTSGLAWQTLVGRASLILVFGLAPTLTVLLLLLSRDRVWYLSLAQSILLIAGTITFIINGVAAQTVETPTPN